jgi:hypothetical protein
MEAKVRVAFEKRKRQYLAGAVGEEVPIGPVPSPDGIILDVDLWKQHQLDYFTLSASHILISD